MITINFIAAYLISFFQHRSYMLIPDQPIYFHFKTDYSLARKVSNASLWLPGQVSQDKVGR